MVALEHTVHLGRSCLLNFLVLGCSPRERMSGIYLIEAPLERVRTQVVQRKVHRRAAGLVAGQEEQEQILHQLLQQNHTDDQPLDRSN